MSGVEDSCAVPANSMESQERGSNHQRLVGYAPGGWDMFHIGHLNVIRRSREACDYLIVGVASDQSLFLQKNRAPIVPLEERIEIVRAIRYVDEVIVDDSPDKRAAWAKRRFDVLFKGNDWLGTEKGERLEQRMAEIGVRVHYLPYTPDTSSTMLRSVLGTLTDEDQIASGRTE